MEKEVEKGYPAEGRAEKFRALQAGAYTLAPS